MRSVILADRLPVQRDDLQVVRGAVRSERGLGAANQHPNHALLAHLDLEYVTFDHSSKPDLSPEFTFALRRPVIQVLAQALSRGWEVCWA